MPATLTPAQCRSLDKFYTNQAASRRFIELVRHHVDLSRFDLIVEPSAGAGALLSHMPEGVPVIALDIAPEATGIRQADFLQWQPDPLTLPVAVIGNPPFGPRSKLALDFFKHAATFADVIAFIVPVTWENFSIHKQIPPGWGLISSERLPGESFEFMGQPFPARCCIQVWRLQECPGLRKLAKEPDTHPDFDFVAHDGDWDASILILSNPSAPPRKWLYGFDGGGASTVNRLYLKFANERAQKVMTGITITNEMTKGLNPRVTKALLVDLYSQAIAA
ncbi:MAG: hypothetical protein ACRCXB_23015 [Aeromonadaceae bacterium]